MASNLYFLNSMVLLKEPEVCNIKYRDHLVCRLFSRQRVKIASLIRYEKNSKESFYPLKCDTISKEYIYANIAKSSNQPSHYFCRYRYRKEVPIISRPHSRHASDWSLGIGVGVFGK